jgi:hypothetical protein
MPFEVPERFSGATPDPVRLARVRQAFARSAAPVRPLPSNAAMMLLCVGVFAGLAILLATPAGFFGFARMSASARWMEYSAILLLALVLSGGVVEQMIPGSRRTLRPVLAILFAVFLLSLTTVVLFPYFDVQDFVPHGVPCLRFGLLCSIPASGLTWVLMRKGFVTDPVSGAATGGALSGLLGLAVLALHCPIFNALHIIAWHVGVIAIASLAGALVGFILVQRQQS